MTIFFFADIFISVIFTKIADQILFHWTQILKIYFITVSDSVLGLLCLLMMMYIGTRGCELILDMCIFLSFFLSFFHSFFLSVCLSVCLSYLSLSFIAQHVESWETKCGPPDKHFLHTLLFRLFVIRGTTLQKTDK